MRQSRMGLIQTVDQLKFSYMAIVQGAREANLISSESAALSAMLPYFNKMKLNSSALPSAYTTIPAKGCPLDSSSSDSSSDFDYGLGPPPLPPPRSESLLSSNSNLQGVPEQRLYQRNEQVYVNGNDGSGPGLLLPADIAELVGDYNDIPQNLSVTNGDRESATFYDTNQESKHTEIPRNEKVDLFANSDSSIASPTKYILNNHKLEERKR